MAKFRYHPLDISQSDIRLLTLHPGPRDAPVSCSLTHVSLTLNPEYEALSYTWGDKKNIGSISMDGCTFEVRSNLETALRYLRLPDSPRVLWIDALCINQDDVAEKNAQVPRIGEIYQQAAQVLAWLGEGGDGGEEAIDVMHEFGTILYQGWAVEKMSRDQMGLTWLKNKGFDVPSKNLDAVWRLWSRPYWSRIWIVQELACSTIPSPMVFDSESRERCLIGCGEKWLPSKLFTCLGLYFSGDLTLDIFFNASFQLEDRPMEKKRQRRRSKLAQKIKSLFRHDDPADSPEPPVAQYVADLDSVRQRDIPPAIHMFRTLGRTSAKFGSQHANSITKLLAVTGGFQATDDRDKVYGLLGMSEEPDVIVPNYAETNTLQLVLRDLVKELITKTKSIDILLGNRSPTTECGPTWEPQVFGLGPRSAAWFHGNLFQFGGSTDLIDVGFEASSDGILHIRGIELGRAKTVMGPFPASLVDRRLPTSLEGQDRDDEHNRESVWVFKRAFCICKDPGLGRERSLLAGIAAECESRGTRHD
ncbi:heterokaryon incompatibility protein-domain-containing protein [Stachybotrys elegans]|uniref:Heterokaryon incompatibility protein-domain-containing protein n=1 Tax=Stachybotrys elegans TaxID=80388 RepID=A0A8K0SFX9_9HYPO|nr:heterokaryon incompatibility protein-domain-containing protein [Stachybotrys elegans]